MAGIDYSRRILDTRISTVIFDFGGVLGLPQDPTRVAAMAAICRLPVERFRREYQVDRLELDRGTLLKEDYWSRIMAVGGVTPTRDIVEEIEREDALGWTAINRVVVAWAAELRHAGYRTAILSNMPPDKLAFMRSSRDFDFIDEFDAAFFSCDHRLVKPEPGFYRLCLSGLGTHPAQCLFLDDSEVNAAGARAMGIHAILFRSARETAEVVSRDWDVPVRSLLDGAAEPGRR